MCEFFSCIVKKDGSVLWDKNVNSHEEIIEKFKLDANNHETKQYVRIEVTAKDGDVFNHDIKNWKIKIDESTTPTWYERQQTTLYENNIFKALKQCFKEIFVIKQVGVTLSDGRFFVKDSEITKLEKQAIIQVLKGSSIVKNMGDSSIVKYMRDSSIVKDMRGSSIVRTSKYSNIKKPKLGDESVWIDRKNRVVCVGKKKVKY